MESMGEDLLDRSFHAGEDDIPAVPTRPEEEEIAFATAQTEADDVVFPLRQPHRPERLRRVQMPVRGSWAHARAGDRLTERTGLGFLARDIAVELTPAIKEANG